MGIHLIVALKAKPSRMADLQATLTTLVAQSSKEAGCISYRAAFAEDGETAFVVEHWRDQAALDAHNQTPHFTEGVKQLQDACLEVQIHPVSWQD